MYFLFTWKSHCFVSLKQQNAQISYEIQNSEPNKTVASLVSHNGVRYKICEREIMVAADKDTNLIEIFYFP